MEMRTERWTRMRRRFSGKTLTDILIFGVILCIAIQSIAFFENQTVLAYAAEQTEQQEDSTSQILQENLLDEIQIDDMQKMLDEIMADHSFSVRKVLTNIINGDDPISKETVRSFLYSLFFSEIENEKGLIMKLLLIILIFTLVTDRYTDEGTSRGGALL